MDTVSQLQNMRQMCCQKLEPKKGGEFLPMQRLMKVVAANYKGKQVRSYG